MTGQVCGGGLLDQRSASAQQLPEPLGLLVTKSTPRCSVKCLFSCSHSLEPLRPYRGIPSTPSSVQFCKSSNGGQWQRAHCAEVESHMRSTWPTLQFNIGQERGVVLLPLLFSIHVGIAMPTVFECLCGYWVIRYGVMFPCCVPMCVSETHASPSLPASQHQVFFIFHGFGDRCLRTEEAGASTWTLRRALLGCPHDIRKAEKLFIMEELPPAPRCVWLPV